MEYLKPYQYYILIGDIFGSVSETVTEYLKLKYEIYNKSNPRFIHLLGDCIIEIFKVVEPQNLEFKNNWLIRNPDSLLIPPSPNTYYFDTQYLKRSFTLEEFSNLIIGFNNFKDFVSELNEIQKNTSDALHNKRIIKLDWKGQKNQLYFVIRELKNKYEFINNSYNEIAEFLIENVSGFQNTKKETVEKELKKNTKLPKNKRVEIKLNE